MISGKVGAIRTLDMHERQVAEVELAPDLCRLCGVKERSPMADVPYFNSIQSLPSDIVYDIVEEVVKELLQLLIKHFAEKNTS